jgi:hypothetical protein
MTKKPTPARKREVLNISPEDWKGRIKDLGGSMSDDFNNILINQAYKATWTAHSDDNDKVSQQIAICAALNGIRPRDEVEGMLAVQMVSIHNAAMECLRRSMIEQQTFEGRREALNQATKLSRTYTMQMEALARHRNKDGQKVRVEHVHVHPGAQAVVGVVEASGGGGQPKIESQSHAQTAVAHAPEQTLRGEDEVRDAVSVSGDGEWSM